MGSYVTLTRYKCTVCSAWVERKDPIAQTRQLEHVSWIRTWVHPGCVKQGPEAVDALAAV